MMTGEVGEADAEVLPQAAKKGTRTLKNQKAKHMAPGWILVPVFMFFMHRSSS